MRVYFFLMQSLTLFHKGFRSSQGMRDPSWLHRPWSEASPCTAQSLKEDITVQLAPVKTPQHPLLCPFTILLSSPLYLQILPQPPWEWLCPCASSCARLPPDLSIQSHPSPFLTHRSIFLGWSLLQCGSQLEQGSGITDNLYPDGDKEIMGCGIGLHIAPLGTGGPALDQRSHITPETYRTVAASVSKEHLSVPGPCSAQAETEQLCAAHRS